MYKNFILGFGALSFVATSAFAAPVYVVEGNFAVTGAAASTEGEQITWGRTEVEGDSVGVTVTANAQGTTTTLYTAPEGVTLFDTAGISAQGNYKAANGIDEFGTQKAIIFGPSNSVTVLDTGNLDNNVLTVKDDGSYVAMVGNKVYSGSVSGGLGDELAPGMIYSTVDVYGFANNPDGSFKHAAGVVPIGANGIRAGKISGGVVTLLPGSNLSAIDTVSNDGNFGGGIDGVRAAVWDLINETEEFVLNETGEFQEGYVFSIISTGALSGEDLNGLGWISVGGIARNAWEFLVNVVGLNIDPSETIGRVYLSEDPINQNVNVHWQGSIGMAYQVSSSFFAPNLDVPEPTSSALILVALGLLFVNSKSNLLFAGRRIDS